ncbi:MAG: GspE/PulE family protein [Candidatus Sumerlaeia bacterium]
MTQIIFNTLTAWAVPAAVLDVYEKVEFIPQLAADFSPILLVAIIFLILFYEVPVYVNRKQVLSGNKTALQYTPNVRQWGLPGYLGYLKAKGGSKKTKTDDSKIEAPAKKKKKKNKKQKSEDTISGTKAGTFKCSACHNPIDVLRDYEENLVFHKCPHCNAEIEPIFGFTDYIQALIEKLSNMVSEPKKRRKKNEDILSTKAMSDLLKATYHMAMAYRATDIHIERDEKGALVQFRVDGVLSDAFKVPKVLSPAYLSAIKVQANLDITNHMTPQDGRFNLEVNRVKFDVRINCAPTSSMGEICFMRLLDKRNIQISPAELGFAGKNLEYFNEAIHKPHGLVLVTGPTGSGKSTSLYVALNQINTGEKNIVTIEDPVEYQIEGLKQMQVNPEKKFTFATGLRSILRQDPDIIMVGEIRDSETAIMAVDAAATGHLVFTTLHTMDTATAISRLADLGVPAKRYSQALEIIIAQRLIRLICPECKQVAPATEKQLHDLAITKMGKDIKFHAGIGCPHCNYTGYYGREAILEILKPTDQIQNLLERESRPAIIRDVARREGMKLLRQEGVLKAVAGRTTLQEVIDKTK